MSANIDYTKSYLECSVSMKNADGEDVEMSKEQQCEILKQVPYKVEYEIPTKKRDCNGKQKNEKHFIYNNLGQAITIDRELFERYPSKTPLE